MPQISSRLEQWAIEALELGFERFSAGDHQPFIVAVDEDAEHHLVEVRSTSGQVDADLIALARELVSSAFATAQSYAIVWDGLLTTDERKEDAVIAEAGVSQAKQAYAFAQVYQVKKRSKKLEQVGDPIVAETAKQLLRSRQRTVKRARQPAAPAKKRKTATRKKPRK